MSDRRATFSLDFVGRDKGATRLLDELEAKGAKLEKRIDSIRAKMVEMANAMKVGGGGFDSFDDLNKYVASYKPGQAKAAIPQPLQREAQNLRNAQAERANLGRTQDDRSEQRQNQRDENRPRARQRSFQDQVDRVRGLADDQGQRSFLQSLARTMASTRTLNQVGAFSNMGAGGLGTNLFSFFVKSLLNSNQAIGTTLTSPLTNGLRSFAASRSAEAMVGDLPMTGATTAGAPLAVRAAAGLADIMPTIATAAVGAIAAGLTATVTASVFEAQQERLMQQMRANVGGVGPLTVAGLPHAGGFMQSQRGDYAADFVTNARFFAQHFGFDEQTGYNTAIQLGLSGITRDRMGTAGNLNRPGALGATFSIAAATGMDPSQIAQMVSFQMVQGGQSAQQVIKSFIDLQKAAEKTKIPIDLMVSSFMSLEQATGGANVSMRSVGVLQGALGPGINAGNLISPLASAYGGQAIATSGFLGIPLQQFASTQQDATKMFGLVQGFAQRQFKGQDSLRNRELLDWYVQSTGLLNLQGIPPQLQDRLMGSLITGNNVDLKKASADLAAYQKAHPESGQTFEQAMLDLGGKEQSILDHIQNLLDNIKSGIAQMYQQFMPILSAIPNAIQSLGSILQNILNAIQPIADWIKDKLGIKDKTSPGSGRSGPNGTGITVDQEKIRPGVGWSPSDDLTGGLSIPDTHGGKAWASQQELKTLYDAGKKYGVPLAIMATIAARESDLGATSKNIAQITPVALSQINKTYGTKYSMADMMDPAKNAMAEAAYLKYLIGKGNFSVWNDAINAIQAYGPGAGNPGGTNYGSDVYQASLQLDVTLNQWNPDGTKTTTQKTANTPLRRAPKGERAHGHPMPPPGVRR